MQGAATSTGQRTWLSLQGQRVRTRAVGTEVIKKPDSEQLICALRIKLIKMNMKNPILTLFFHAIFFQVFNLIGNITS